MFYHLKTSLTDEPRKILAKLDTTADKYTIAWQLLKDKYENKSLTIYNHIKGIFEKPSLKHESHVGLRDLSNWIHDQIQGELSTMQDMQTFSSERCQILEKINNDNDTRVKPFFGYKGNTFDKHSSQSLHTGDVKCYFRKQNNFM